MEDEAAGHPNDEAAVLLRFRQGERDAFEWLVRQYRQPAVGFAYHLTGDYHTAEDLAQDSFAYLLVYPERFDARASFKTYLFTILRNKSIDSLRKRQRTLPVEAGMRRRPDSSFSGDYTGDNLPEGNRMPPPGLDDPERMAIVHEEDREWQRRLLTLKPDYRMAVYLVDVGEMSYTEAAAIMGRTTVSFKVLLHRARKKLRQIYEKEEWDCEASRRGTSVSRGSVPESPSAGV
jgi:RNA polymerase sigma-70 factor (ECF subfamily)